MDKNLIMTYEERMKEEKRRFEKKQQWETGEKSKIFCKLGLSSFIYAIVYTFCLYQNMNGVTSLLWTAISVGYLYYVIKSSGKKFKKDSWFLAGVMLLLGISNFLTGNLWIVFLNYTVIFVLMIGILLHNFYEDVTWDFGKYGQEIVVSIFGAVGKILSPFSDGEAFLKQHRSKENKRIEYLFAGVGIAVPCVLILTGLLCQADMVFADIIGRVFKNIIIPTKIFGIIFMLCFGFFSSYCGVRYIALRNRKETVNEKKTAEPLIAIIILGMVLSVYLVFCGIQIVYLFLGAGTLPEGVTYAEYARTGFFQLLFICILNIFVVLAMKKYFKENRLLNGCLLAVCGCTFVMTASSAYRMMLYISAYYLTVLRFFVLSALLAIAVVMVGVTVFVIKKDFPLLKFTVAALCIIYVALAFSRMDYVIADYNLNHCKSSAEAIDYGYISCLSTDAAPVVAEYGKKHPILQKKCEKWRSENAIECDDTTWYMEESLERDDDIWYYEYWLSNEKAMKTHSLRKWNVSHFQAEKLWKVIVTDR